MTDLKSDKKITTKDLRQITTYKMYPYLQEKIENYQTKLNNIAYDEFEPKYIRDCLFGKYRGSNFNGFNRSLSIEFLLEIFDELDNDIDRKNLIIPKMESFFEKKRSVEVIEEKK